ncbi:MAG: hypothetical protein QXG08_03275 [Candidatus Methanomethyliaceae archaeon]
MQFNPVKTYVALMLPTILAGLIIFIITPPQFSYSLFFLFLLLSLNITLTMLGKEFTMKLQVRISDTTPYFFFIIASAILTLLQISNIFIEIINAILYMIVFILALGLSLLAIFGFKPNYSHIELLAIAYPISLAFLAVLGTLTFFAPLSVRGSIISIVIIFLTIVAFIIKRRKKQTDNKALHEITINNGTLTLITALIILTFIYVALYPKITSLLGLDIIDNFMRALAFTKSSSVGDLYPLFVVYQSSIIYAVKPSLETFQIIAITLNIFTILTFYAMASQYLKKYSNLAPAIATLIWGLFSGLGWLNFLENKILSPEASMLVLIGQADAFSYGDITWQRLFFYLSMEATLALAFAVLYFLKRNDIPTKKHAVLMLLLITPIPLMHEYATYFLLLTLFCFAIICKNELRTQLRSTGIALIFASFTYVLLSLLLNATGLKATPSVLTFFEYLISGPILIIPNYIKNPSMQPIKFHEKNVCWKTLVTTIMTILTIFYFACIILWFSGDMPFVFSNLNSFGYVPWFLYPVKLGLTGILVIISVLFLIKDSKYFTKELLAMLASAILLIALSRLIATLQMQYAYMFTFNPNSWLTETLRKTLLAFREERMFEIFKIPLSIIASLTLGVFLASKNKITNKKCFIVGGIVSLILISGISSTILSFTYYYEQIQANTLSPSEMDILQKMQSKVYANGKATIITPQTPTPYLDFTGATAIVTESIAAWSSKSPELPLFVTRYSKTTPTYIYLHKTRDYQKLSEFFGNYLEHLSNTAYTYLENQDVEIKVIDNWSIPTPQSSTALVIPYNAETMAISKPFSQEVYKKYATLALFFEEKMEFMNVYQKPITYNNVEVTNRTAIFNGLNSYIRINGTNTNFNKILIELEFRPLNTTINQVIISKFDCGQPSQKSWEIAQYGKRLVFKISADGITEIVLLTTEILTQDTKYNVRCEYDGKYMKIFINNNLAASRPFKGEIFKSDIDLLIGCELYNNKPTAFANMTLSYVRVLNDIPDEIEGQIFYAYDILSSAGLNYTTILSIDNDLGNYKTLILPYDDIVMYEIINKLENNPDEINIKYIVILNTNGYGPFLNQFGKLTDQTFIAKSIAISNKHFSINSPFIVPIINFNNNLEATAYYTNRISSSPMIIKTIQNQTTIIYINVYPLIEKNLLINPVISAILMEEMGNYIERYDEKGVTKWFTEPSLLFTQFQANGTINIQSEAINLINIQGNQTSYYINGKIISIECRDLITECGYGFYSVITAHNPTITTQSNSNTTININGNVTFLVKQPKIKVNGSIRFKDFYILHPPTIYANGRAASLSGNITLEICTSDKYSIALPYSFDSPITVRYDKPLMEFDEILSFLKLITPLIIVLILLSTFYLLAQQHRQGNSIQQKNQGKET